MTTNRIASLVRTLADGRWQELDDPAAAREALAGVDVTLEIDSTGLARIDAPLDLLDESRIRARFDASTAGLVARMDVHMTIDSTNDALQRAAPPAPGKARVCLAEFQQAGRGRRGRRWLAPLGQSLCASVAWRFEDAPRHLGALSLAIGVAVADALREARVEGIELKWPNDLLCDGRKLGGLLIDAHGNAGDCTVVVGLGLNVRLDELQRSRIDALNGLAPISLACVGAPLAGQRNRLAALLVGAIVGVLGRFGSAGLGPWAQRWRELDTLAGQVVEVRTATGNFAGRALGVDESGALLVEHDERMSRVLAADVSVRAQ